MMRSFLTRTVSFLNYLDQNDSLPTYFLRTNLSTLFHFEKMIKWLEDKPTDNFFAGSINLFNKGVFFSGTNLLLTKDMCKFVLQNIDNLSPIMKDIGDDFAISLLIMLNTNVQVCAIKRIDFSVLKKDDTYTNIVEYLTCSDTEQNVFCLRFKTLDRLFDIKLMDTLLNLLDDPNFNIHDFIKKYNVPTYLSRPELIYTTEKIFPLQWR